MKKPGFSFLLGITLIFVGFTIGFLTGRSSVKEPIAVSVPLELMVAETKPRETVQETEEKVVVSFPLDINTATAEQLQQLPGIGEVLAKRIVEYRQSQGVFHSTEELALVEGIAEGKLAKVLPLVCIGGENEDTCSG